ncbi:hypothetical protein [Neptuniibacter sp. 2_MG-2023]|uniref:flagellar protein FliT n=1 Tax=Neptuniibacter sp. 2_MG-2023 TaxID=3062671 RepID=UPI0026E2065F|nr:hypothetical protein [Neptuniibacter sp. 2_MG-2023]MDO6514514.1 hypothetical protein [Neptuniibacter sp. 2_MG-2023]
MNPLIKLAEEALEQSTNMEVLAQEGRWDELTDLQKIHTATVEKIMTAEADDAIKSQLRALLLEIKTTNNRTMDLAGDYKLKLVKEKKTLGQGAKMQKMLNALK